MHNIVATVAVTVAVTDTVAAAIAVAIAVAIVVGCLVVVCLFPLFLSYVRNTQCSKRGAAYAPTHFDVLIKRVIV